MPLLNKIRVFLVLLLLTLCGTMCILFPTTSDNYNESPIVKINGPYVGSTDGVVQFKSNGSFDKDGIILSYFWDFGDGSVATIDNPVHKYIDSGEYVVTLKVTDNKKATTVTETVALIHICDDYLRGLASHKIL